jgi:hypothetical protein
MVFGLLEALSADAACAARLLSGANRVNLPAISCGAERSVVSLAAFVFIVADHHELTCN